MYQLTEGQVERNEYSTIPFKWIRSEQPNNSICIMLPGLGYTTKRPLFHYATGVCLNNKIDVLHVNYEFAKNEHFKKLSETEQENWMYEDVKAVVREVVKDINYEQCFLLSKSIGTIPMAMEWTEKNFIHNSVGIWLTPLIKNENVYQALLKTELPSLCIIGDQDNHFIEDRIYSIKNNECVSTVVIPNADHSLEIKEDILASIDAAKEVITAIQDFIIKNKQ
ncbi:alpha/beta family hydrolase [Neobacillus sp.]|uniref:alpha/beta family hydrolase n=1 Tax=Neobacillus sp. TaxID=2675273 RepID=UPI00289DC09F|nr:alpha/beta family hydrolase [Neobacillus sp.]